MKKYRMTFDSIDKAYSAFCEQHYCDSCPISKESADKKLSCKDFKNSFHDKAAELMGLEVIEAEDKPCLTEAELAICKAVGTKWVSINDDGGDVELWDEEPYKENGTYFIGYPPSPFGLARIASGLFPSFNPGDCVNVEGILKEAEK